MLPKSLLESRECNKSMVRWCTEVATLRSPTATVLPRVATVKSLKNVLSIEFKMLEHFEIKFRSLTLKQLQLLDRPLLTCGSMLQFELRNLFHMNYSFWITILWFFWRSTFQDVSLALHFLKQFLAKSPVSTANETVNFSLISIDFDCDKRKFLDRNL